MIVEDDEDIRRNLSRALRAEGYRIAEAANGRHALDALASLGEGELPSCILLDLMMPVMDGSTFLEVLRSEHAADWAKIPVIVNTAKGSATVDVGELPGVVARLHKPVDLDRLYQTVARFARPE